MTLFGDDEPEDAWHPDDPPAEQLENLARRVRLLVGLRALNDRDVHRIDQLLEDLRFVAGRLAS